MAQFVQFTTIDGGQILVNVDQIDVIQTNPARDRCTLAFTHGRWYVVEGDLNAVHARLAPRTQADKEV